MPSDDEPTWRPPAAPREIADEKTGVHNRTQRLTELAQKVDAQGARLEVVESDVKGIARTLDWQNATLRDQSRVLSELHVSSIKEHSTRATTETEEAANVRIQRSERRTKLFALIVAAVVALLEILTRLGGCS